jgi:CRISPR system Cascade subunit CasE
MYISSLLVDVGENPDRPRPGRLWLRNRYRVHQRLCMAFPSADRKSSDPDFLTPYNAGDFGSNHVHVSRAMDAGFLFRVDPLLGGRVMVVVQSAIVPDWDYAFHNAEYLLAAPVDVKPYDPHFTQGQRLRFRLDVNPTLKIDTKTGPDGRRRHGRRVPVNYDRLGEWLVRRAMSAGFSVDEGSFNIKPGYVYVNTKRNSDGQRLRSARYEGVLEVTDPGGFRETLGRGIGPGKGFGFGLLSVAPA